MPKNIAKLSKALAVFAVAVLLVAGCSKHSDLPSPLGFITPPTPTNINIVDDGGGAYQVSWSIDDAAIVSYYRLYSVTVFGTSYVDSTASTEIGVIFPYQAAGWVVGVTAVTVENIEGAMATAATPEPAAAPATSRE
jgi:hypothetical protein